MRENLWPSPLSLKPGTCLKPKQCTSTISLFMPKSVKSTSPHCSQIPYLRGPWENPEIYNLSALSGLIFCFYTGSVFYPSCPLILFSSTVPAHTLDMIFNVEPMILNLPSQFCVQFVLFSQTRAGHSHYEPCSIKKLCSGSE